MLKLESIVERPINGTPTKVRNYKNTMTGNDLTTYHLYTDKFGNTWWTFEDLFALPFIRQFTAKKVLDLYGNGLTLEDVKSITAQVKTILRSDSGERYEQAYAKILELENLTETMADPVKQCMGLCTVYLLFNDEMPDAWSNQVTSQKMTAMAHDLEAQAFFLTWWTDIMRRSGKVLKGLSRIASTANQWSENATSAPSN